LPAGRRGTTKSTDIDLEVIEQVPISANAEIKIMLDDAGGGAYTAESGKLGWKLKLQPVKRSKCDLVLQSNFLNRKEFIVRNSESS
jgi:hypothetical protein